MCACVCVFWLSSHRRHPDSHLRRKEHLTFFLHSFVSHVLNVLPLFIRFPYSFHLTTRLSSFRLTLPYLHTYTSASLHRYLVIFLFFYLLSTPLTLLPSPQPNHSSRTAIHLNPTYIHMPTSIPHREAQNPDHTNYTTPQHTKSSHHTTPHERLPSPNTDTIHHTKEPMLSATHHHFYTQPPSVAHPHVIILTLTHYRRSSSWLPHILLSPLFSSSPVESLFSH